MNESAALEVLAFSPHPDDAELFCGGLLASMSARGYRTGIVDLTRGEMASRGTPEVRGVEAANAARVLGLAVRENLGLPDAWLSAFDDGEEPRSDAPVVRIVEVIRRLRPEIVVAPWRHERHPDHEAASALVTRALFLAAVRKLATEPSHEPFAPRQVLYYPMRDLAQPDVVVDISDAFERKMAAIRCHASQVEPRGEGPATLVGSALSLPSLEARDRFYGAHIGVAHGEPYVVRDTPGLCDPVDHFRRNTFARPLFFRERR